MKVRTFIETYPQQKPVWREVKALGDGGGAAAAVYMDDAGIPVAAFFTIQTESGDWILYADYYFRPDGSLAKRHERLNTFHGNAAVIRDAFFGCRGEVHRRTSRHLDLQTKKEKRPAPEFVDEHAPLFQRIQDLPFSSALKHKN